MDIFLKRCEQPWARCLNDCFSAPADQLFETFGVDVMARFRGRYKTALGYMRAVKKAGYEDEIEAFECEMKKAGFELCNPPYTNFDTGIIRYLEGVKLISAPAIMHSGMWNIRSKSGWLALSADTEAEKVYRYGN